MKPLDSDSRLSGVPASWVDADAIQLIRRLADRLSRAEPILGAGAERGSTGRHMSPRSYVWRLLREWRRRATARANPPELRAILQDYGSSLRASGVAPERLVPHVRQVMRRVADASGITGDQAIRVIELGILWGIEGYYREYGDEAGIPTSHGVFEQPDDASPEQGEPRHTL